MGTLGRVTMNPPLSSMVAGDLATTWRRIVAMTIVTITLIQQGEVATNTGLGELTDLRHLLARFRLFHRSHVLVARDHVEVQPDKDLECLSGRL
jgi:hypothetical protein